MDLLVATDAFLASCLLSPFPYLLSHPEKMGVLSMAGKGVWWIFFSYIAFRSTSFCAHLLAFAKFVLTFAVGAAFYWSKLTCLEVLQQLCLVCLPHLYTISFRGL